MGLRGATELCGDAGHTDARFPESCWALAAVLYPGLSVPRITDPGPWDVDDPVVEIDR
jgi:hypothetical protein